MLKMCEKHWEKCKEKVKSKGLWHLVSDDVEELTDKLANTENKRAYDPLFNLTFMIVAHAIECGGDYLMSNEDDEEEEFFCPLCEAVKKTEREDMDDNWIDGAMKEVYETCVKLSIQG